MTAPRRSDGSALVLGALLLASCATTSTVERQGSKHAAKESDCEIAFFDKVDVKPTVPYETIGKVESHIAKNFFFGGRAQLEDEGHRELRAKACEIGGDGVIVEDVLQTSAAEMTHLHIWATVIRLRRAPG